MSGLPIMELAGVIRSKNCSPWSVALDVIFHRREVFEAARRADAFRKEIIADCYGVPVNQVRAVHYFAPAKAVKIVLKRTVASGTIGDGDVYGAQQHAPLLGLQIRLDED